WMGRYLDVAGDSDNPLQGLSLDDTLSPALAAAQVPVAAVANPAQYDFWTPGVGDPVTGPMLDAVGTLGRLSAPDTAFAQARGVAARIDRLRGQLAPYQSSEAHTHYGSSIT